MRFILILLFSFVFIGSSCRTVEEVKKPVIVDTSPSWDGNEQNSGVLEYIDDKGWHITQKAANRYSELTKKYGNMFIPELKRGEGLEPQEDGTFIIKNEYMVKFVLMNKKHKAS